MNIFEYYVELRDKVCESATLDLDRNKAFFDFAVNIMLEIGYKDPHYYYYQKGFLEINGLDLDVIEDGNEYNQSQITLFICDYSDNSDIQVANKDLLERKIGRLNRFFNESISNKLDKKLIEDSPAGYDASHIILINKRKFSKVKYVLLTNKQVSIRNNELDLPLNDDYEISIDIWDIKRFYNYEISRGSSEEITINLEEEFGQTLPALKGSNTDYYSSYLTIITGDMLADIYQKYGSKLMESNVRGFLQFKGKGTNAGIRKTIANNPELFFAYNNGISAIAKKVEFNDKREITHISDLQIVNGGQTTASLERARHKDKVSLSNVFVQVKLCVVNELQKDREDLISNISLFSNTQNKIEQSDYSSNSKYHILIEQLSRKTATESRGNSIDTYSWFYERIRGQYPEERHINRANLKDFDKKFPKKYVFGKIDLAKSSLAFEPNPCVLAKGSQREIMTVFVQSISTLDSQLINQSYYIKVISQLILYKKIHSVIKKHILTGKVMLVANYTLAILLKIFSEFNNKEINLQKIWSDQDLSDQFCEEIICLAISVEDKIQILSRKKNLDIAAYCKRRETLEEVFGFFHDYTFSDNVLIYFVKKGSSANNIRKDANELKKLQEIRRTELLLEQETSYWLEIKQRLRDLDLLNYDDFYILEKMIKFSESRKSSLAPSKSELTKLYTLMMNNSFIASEE